MGIKVVNKKNLSDPLPGVTRVYVGRPSPLGNPFSIGEHGFRKDVIVAYRRWFYDNLHTPALKKVLNYLSNIAVSGKLELVCWCSPLECHADVIKEYLLNADDLYRLESHKTHVFKVDHSFSEAFPEEELEDPWSMSFRMICVDDPSIIVEEYIDYDNLIPFEP